MSFNYSSQQNRQAEVSRRLAFASRWSLPDEDGIEQNQNAQNEPSGPLYEPCAMGDETMSLPVELFSLSLEDLKSIFSLDTWNTLDSATKESLKSFLPSGKHAPSADVAVQKLFSGQNVKFGNPMTQFCEDLLAGEYNAEVQKYKQQVERLEYQQRMLSVKLYHNRFVKHALDAKKKMGMKVDEGAVDYYATQPDDADLEESRRLSRAHAALDHRLSQRRRDKQLSSLFMAATSIAMTKDKEGENSASNPRRLVSALTEIGVRLPTKLQIGLPYGEDDIYVSDEDENSSATASAPNSDNEGDVEELYTELEAGADGKKKNLKKRKRDETGKEADPEPSASSVEKRIDRFMRQKPTFAEEVFSLLSHIKTFLTSSASVSSATSAPGASFKAILASVSSVPKLVAQVPLGTTLEKIVSLSIDLLLRNPDSLGVKLAPHKLHMLVPSLPKGENASPDTASVPFMKRVDSHISALEAPNALFAWNLPANHAQNDLLESLEAALWFSLTRGFLTSNGRSVDLEKMKTARSSITLAPLTDAYIKEYRQQEAERYLTPDTTFKFEFANAASGFSSTCTAMPLPRTSPHLRKSMLLKPDRPDRVTNSSIVKDALVRLPGGVGTRADIVSLVLSSQYIATTLLDQAQIGTMISKSLDRLQLDWDSPIRYDSDLRIYMYTQRQRTEADFERAAQIMEQYKRGQSTDFWSQVDEAIKVSALPAVSLQSILDSKSS